MGKSPEHRSQPEQKESFSKQFLRMAGAVALLGLGINLISDSLFRRS